MSTTDIFAMLAHLADLQAQHAAVLQARATALPQYLKVRLDKIDAEYAPKLDALTATMHHTEHHLKAAVLAHGKSVKGEKLQAVYMAGRETWDGKALAGYAVEHQAILAFRSVGAPSVSLRQVKESA